MSLILEQIIAIRIVISIFIMALVVLGKLCRDAWGFNEVLRFRGWSEGGLQEDYSA